MYQYIPSGDNCDICYRPKLCGNNIKVVDCYLKTCPSSVFHPLSLYRNGHATQIIHKHRQLLVRSRIPRFQRSGHHITCALTEDINTVATAFAPGLNGESTTVGWDSHAAGGFGTFIVTTPAQVQAANPQDGYGTFLDNTESLTDDIATLAPSFAQAIDGESTTATAPLPFHPKQRPTSLSPLTDSAKAIALAQTASMRTQASRMWAL
ncbi:hypothetical protein C8F01DRAFT_1345821 [Mycena amicta]|nr:hypothetical protein C8F01DRAFT_1372947 [Mycena amicta]KAJ7066007.1 hypothetical protein C8F01DRAFT_1345821 [Mycena amicta]